MRLMVARLMRRGIRCCTVPRQFDTFRGRPGEWWQSGVGKPDHRRRGCDGPRSDIRPTEGATRTDWITGPVRCDRVERGVASLNCRSPKSSTKASMDSFPCLAPNRR